MPDVSTDRNDTICRSSGTGAERVRISLDLSYGTALEYTRRFVRLLVHLARQFILWPSPQRRQLPALLKPRHKSIFLGCIGFLEGSEISLQSKPKYDHGTSQARCMVSTCKLSVTGVADLSIRLPAILPALMIQRPSKTAFCTENDRHTCLMMSAFLQTESAWSPCFYPRHTKNQSPDSTAMLHSTMYIQPPERKLNTPLAY